MNELQIRLLDMLAWYHDVCQKENLRYFVLGGTALGTKRHSGFIPWDDDIDVGMPRKDYEKFIHLGNKYGNKYVVEVPGQNKDFMYPYGKIYDTGTTLIENTRFKIKRGIYIDVFPLDGAGNTLEESKKKFKETDKLINILCTRSCALRPGRSFFKNAAIALSRCIPEFIVNSQKLMKKIDTISKRLDYDECEYIANYAGNWHEKEISKRSWFGKPQLYKFEHLEVCGAEDLDSYLTCMYGDYMTLPPVEKRVTHHDYIAMDLNKSYLED